MPLILYARASDLRKFTLETLKETFSWVHKIKRKKIVKLHDKDTKVVLCFYKNLLKIKKIEISSNERKTLEKFPSSAH